MAKNIVVLADGTGQEGGKEAAANTNIYTLFNMLETRTPRQVVYYDPGLGVGWHRFAGKIAGLGMSRNVKQAYRFIFDHYEADDRIFLLGFSRGAATVRSLSGFIHRFGILPKGRADLIDRAYEIYRTRGYASEWRAERALRRKMDVAFGRWLATHREAGLLPTEALAGRIRRAADSLADDDGPDRSLDAELHEVLVHALDAAAGRPLVEANASFERFRKSRQFKETWTQEAMHQRQQRAALVRSQLTQAAEDLLGAVEGSKERSKQRRRLMREFQLRARRQALFAANRVQPVPIEFLGCFDTVAALGVPSPTVNAIAERVPGLEHSFHDFRLAPNVRHAYHALAIDDERRPFAPLFWDEFRAASGTGHSCDSPRCREERPQGLRQVWFVGMHTDIGGGYPHRGLSDIPLAWMVRRAHDHGILLSVDHQETIAEDPGDVLHDSRTRLSERIVYWPPRSRTYAPQSGARLKIPVIHKSVLKRKKESGNVSAVIGGRVREGVGYRPWILEGDKEAGRDFEVEDWDRYDHEELLVEQEALWDEWQEATSKKNADRAARRKAAQQVREQVAQEWNEVWDSWTQR